MNVDKFRGGRAIPDKEVIEFWEKYAVNLGKIILEDDDYKKLFVDKFDEWISLSKLNTLSGLQNFKYKTFTAGTSQVFDSFWMRNHNRRFRCFKGEFFYHKANWKKFHDWKYLEEDTIEKNDAVVISFPFSDYCKQHPKMIEVLEKCELLKVPVLIDCAYYVICKNLNFDFSKYECIEDITFSVSKGFYLGNKIRAGIRYSKTFTDDNIDIMNEWNQVNHISAYLGYELLSKFSSDYAFNKFESKQKEFCKENNLTPTDCVSFAYGGDEYNELNRGTEVNRLCISDQIGDKV
jgi:hypothetical protein